MFELRNALLLHNLINNVFNPTQFYRTVARTELLFLVASGIRYLGSITQTCLLVTGPRVDSNSCFRAVKMQDITG